MDVFTLSARLPRIREKYLDIASKHIEVRYHFVRDCVISGKIGLEKISTTDNVYKTVYRTDYALNLTLQGS